MLGAGLAMVVTTTSRMAGEDDDEDSNEEVCLLRAYEKRDWVEEKHMSGG